MGRYFLLWLPMPVLAIINGAIRQAFMTDTFGNKAAHQLSTITLIMLLTGYLWIVLSKWQFKNIKQAVGAGSLWFLLTLVFEFILAMVLLKQSFSETIQAYNIIEGELWPLVLVFVLVFPVFFFKMRNGKV